MDLEKFKAITKEVVEAREDQGRVTDLLTQILDDYSTVSARLGKLENENQSLRDTNMRLFLKVGEPAPVKPDETTPPAPAMSFEELFDENGRLK